RKGHFMPASLVDSQFATLEEPGADERAVTADATRTVARIVKDVLG
ncbi:gluconokinase, partial [Mesorhizobium sp. M8A.F.Ca.ET.173.01.1.1]